MDTIDKLTRKRQKMLRRARSYTNEQLLLACQLFAAEIRRHDISRIASKHVQQAKFGVEKSLNQLTVQLLYDCSPDVLSEYRKYAPFSPVKEGIAVLYAVRKRQLDVVKSRIRHWLRKNDTGWSTYLSAESEVLNGLGSDISEVFL